MNRRGFFGMVAGLVASVALPKPVVAKPPAPKVLCILTKQEWMDLDAAVLQAARIQLRQWAGSDSRFSDLQSQSSPRSPG